MDSGSRQTVSGAAETEGDRPQPDSQSPAEGPDDEGGDAACWAHLVCPECGSVEVEGHRPGCPLG